MNAEATINLESAGARAWDAVVAGAGPAGAMAALELAHRGVAVLLADKAAFPRWKACGCCLNAWGQATLKSCLGVPRSGGMIKNASDGVRLAELLNSAVPLTRLELAANGRRAGLPVPHSVAISREAMDAALVRAAIAAGAQFMPETAVRLGPAVPGGRQIILKQGSYEIETRAGVVLAADGLSGRLVAGEPEAAPVTAPASRLGAGVTFACADASYAPGTIYMGCAPEGYVGLVRVEDGRLNAGAALDPEAVRRHGGLGAAAAAVLAGSGLPQPPGFDAQNWKGTPLLTRRLAAPAGERWLALGDAAAYVEPFTGEGMAWALAQGQAVAPLAAAAAREWSPACAARWRSVFEQMMSAKQRRCRRVAGALRHPRLASWIAAGLALFPWAGGRVVEAFTRERCVETRWHHTA